MKDPSHKRYLELVEKVAEFKILIINEQYYDAHEALEEIWFPMRKTKTNYCLILKGFINGAVSLELYKRGKLPQSQKVHLTYLKYTKDNMINKLENTNKLDLLTNLKIFMDNEFSKIEILTV